MAKKVATDIKEMCKAALELQAGLQCDYGVLATFGSWHEVLHYVQTDPSAGDLAVFVRLVEKWGAAQLLKIAKQFKDTERSKVDLTVMTGHRAKGLQYPRVKIGTDFREPLLNEDGMVREMDPAELQLCYVAATRASEHLDCEAVSWIDSYLKGDATPDQLQRWYDRELKKAGDHV
jgi:predicted nucleotidyltransferase